MFPRLITTPKQSFFLFGPRGVGKSTWIEEEFIPLVKKSGFIHIDLLNPKTKRLYQKSPARLIEEVDLLPKKPSWIIIDEVQKIPDLLDAVHFLIEKKKIKFLLSGSSARKLMRGAANLLAGRAFIEKLYPLTFLELKNNFSLEQALNWGTLPKILTYSQAERESFLEAYCNTYLKEEILEELLIRKVQPFINFLEIAAQMDGRFINYSKIADDCGVDHKTISSYYQILEDTLLGFHLPSYHPSIRKRSREASKFYFFDVGVRRQLENTLDIKLTPRSSEWGRAFEALVIQQLKALNSYTQSRFEFFTWSDHSNHEVDLILKKSKQFIFVEIKSSDEIKQATIQQLQKVKAILGQENCRSIILCNEPTQRIVNDIEVWPWQKGIEAIMQFR